MRIPDLRVAIRRDRLATLVTVAALLPIISAMVRALLTRRILLGDNAMIATRAHDVLTQHHPLLGTLSSASVESGVVLNHPGPLLFDVMAPFVRLLGMQHGTVVGIALLNGAAVLGAALLARRVAGRLAMLLVLFASLVIEFTVGSSMLVDPWNPHATIFPFLMLLVAAWGLALGDRRSLIWFIVAGSICLQVHLGAVIVVPALGLSALVIGWGLHRGPDPHPLRPNARYSTRVVGLTLVLWSQPIAESVVNGRGGNFARLASAGGGGAVRIGAVDALRFVSAVLVHAPWRTRGAFMSAIPATGFDTSGALLPVATRSPLGAVASLSLLAVLLAGLAVSARRRGDVAQQALLSITGASIGIAWLSMTLVPIGPFGISAHQMRWMWPIAVGFWSVVALEVAALVVPRFGSAARHVSGCAIAGLAAVIALASIPNFVQPAGPAIQVSLEPTIAELVEQVASARVEGRVLVDHSGTPLFDGTWDAVVATLVEAGVEVRVGDEALARQYGAGRLADGTETSTVTVRWGMDARSVPPGTRRIAFVDPDPSDPSQSMAVYVVSR